MKTTVQHPAATVVKELTQATAWHKDWLVFIFWKMKLNYEFAIWPAD